MVFQVQLNNLNFEFFQMTYMLNRITIIALSSNGCIQFNMKGKINIWVLTLKGIKLNNSGQLYIHRQVKYWIILILFLGKL